MRCRCCDRRLTDAESNSKDKLTGKFFDMCRKCREWSLGVVNSYDNSSDESDYVDQWVKDNIW